MTETELEYQFCFNCNDRKQCYTKPKDCTRIQEEIGEMTNEQWFCSLSTEQKAEWLSKYFHCGDCIFEEPMCGGEYDGCKSAFVKWLKEKHDDLS